MTLSLRSLYARILELVSMFGCNYATKGVLLVVPDSRLSMYARFRVSRFSSLPLLLLMNALFALPMSWALCLSLGHSCPIGFESFTGEQQESQ